MEFKTTYLRNRAMLTDYLDNMMVEEIMEKYRVTKAMVTAGTRQALQIIEEYTDYAGGTSLEMTALQKNKAAILRYMKERIPTTSLTPDAKTILQDTFGEGYGLKPDVVAERWEEVTKGRNPYHYYRPLECIRTWLASEGYLVDNHLTQDTIDEAFAQILAALQSMPAKNGLEINVTDGRLDKKTAYLNATVTQGDHVATRRLKLDFVPAY